MAIEKPDFIRVWASGASSGDVVDPDDAIPGKFEAGWVIELPEYQHFNYLQNLFTERTAYLNEQGIGEWDTDTEYPEGAVVKGSDGELYMALIDNDGFDPISSPTQWDIRNIFTTAEKDKLDGVGAGAEANPDLVSQSEAEAGVATTERTWSALRVAQCASEVVPDPVGKAEAEAGSSNTQRTWSSLRVNQASVAAQPDEVSQAEAEAGTSTEPRIWTPERVGQAIGALGSGSYPEVADHLRTGNKYIQVSNIGASRQLDVYTGLSHATYESVGPSASGADHIMTYLDYLPTAPAILTGILYLKIQPQTSTTNMAGLINAKQHGALSSDETLIATLARRANNLTSSGSDLTSSAYHVELPTDGGGLFDLHYFLTGVGVADIWLYITGFYL